MRCMSLLIILLLIEQATFAQSPHGDNFEVDCSSCHESTSWKVNRENISFSHVETGFELIGQHRSVDCGSCHTSLVFDQVERNCSSCHKDIHQGTTGFDCAKCHSPQSWIVKDINFIHQVSRFPLVGVHQIADCNSCHTEFHSLKFQPIGVDCYDCHAIDYNLTSAPNHVMAGFAVSCADCHSITSSGWGQTNINHNFFPLVQGHAIANCFSCHEVGSNFQGLDQACYSCHRAEYENVQNPNHVAAAFPTACNSCHTIAGWKPASFDHNLTQFPLTGAHINVNCSNCHSAGYTNTPTDCYSCHQSDYNSTINPNHIAANFPTTCNSCHTTGAWTPASFEHDAQYFPIYSGKHREKWDACSDCHTNPNNFMVFSCLTCHEHNQNDMDNDHNGVAGYIYSSEACYSCHPNGTKEGAFNHQQSNFPLTGSHLNLSCAQCHQSGYTGTSKVCVDCHQADYNSSANPNHTALTLSTDCESCHTTNPDWQPATFAVHNNYYQLIGAHNSIASQCGSCHNGNYISTPNTCYTCHTEDYNNSSNPPHGTTGFSTECETCHSQTAWQPSTFDHDAQYFPIYSGKHREEWNVCSDCHTVPSNYAIFSCIDCHEHNRTDMDNDHEGVNGYIYASEQCLSCHPDGKKEGAFNHLTSNFPLTGAHTNVNCLQCHQTGYSGTSTECTACHQSLLNNDHLNAGVSNLCEQCHNSTAWIPSTFNHTTTGFELTGSHAILLCSGCHEGTTNGLNSACISCHQENFNSAINHVSQNYPANCELCHNSVAWDQTDFNHQLTNFPLTGAHSPADCMDCHENGYTGTTTICNDCHNDAYVQATNPDHTTLTLSTDCQTCHSTNPDWQPALFPVHNNFFQLIGAHASISNNCVSCHNGNYNTTPNTCFGCHQSEFLASTDPPHQLLNFSYECLTCHNQNNWNQGTFNHSSYPLSNDHNSVSCGECHSQQNYTPQCLSCHMEDFLDEHDPGDRTDCWNCHSTFTFDVDNSGKLKRLNKQ